MTALPGAVVLAFTAMVLTAGDANAAEPQPPAADAAASRGAALYRSYCVRCHGVGGRGDGRGAPLYAPRPADLVMSPHNDTYKTLIIKGGGQSVGRSQFMPAFGAELAGEQIKDVVAYLAFINVGNPNR